ncbi:MULTISPECIES: NUDIX hydrolase [Proteus]|uniref:NUDIX hydrolase n=1 Tax=Proteus TaxID=583 RepID=UPI001377C987|nr:MULTISPECIES: NUDIX hydrolase [Proteus]MBG5950283.1 NUDIX hydrolase [Proteus terrae]MCE9841357.1 NUDIX hydrolase [Proteus terrae]NBN70615.1 NUDIX domain-containing protein [Proteus sp. G2618]
MFKPHVTVACIVHAKNKFLVVEETVNGKATWNQPAGHLEANETLIQAVQRELWEETGLRLPVQHFLKLHQWIAPDKTPFLRFLFLIETQEQFETQPQDSDINCCHWVSADEIIHSQQLRSPLVRESLLCYQQGERYPLSILSSFGTPFN